ncbi:MAG: putative Fe-S cluster assembly protein SufT [Candidatus Neomarinimicrobiota bacterium]|nr:MAG: putative Fe-S cluster assembly protein SufT [Candidatus Neomarinimicrobiota bacterium]
MNSPIDSNRLIHLERDVLVHLVPSGERVTLLKGEPVRITQALGGTYTIVCNGNMYQLSGADADALGLEPETAPASADTSPGEFRESAVWDQLRTCYDPEIPVNIVDLGLIYDLTILNGTRGGKIVHIKMTLTAPGCGMGGVIAGDAERKVRALPGVEDVLVELVWEPQWNQEMMTEAARLQLGLL